MQSVMTHQFSQVPSVEMERSSFDRSHGLKTTFDAANLVPIFMDEALPGDTFNLNMTGFARLATPLKPVMDNMFMETFFFAVPMRILWENWKKFNGEQVNPGDSTDFLVPSMTSPSGTGYTSQSLHDYLGLPTAIPDLEHTAMFHRAYYQIWNDWFRDQNLQDSLTVPKTDGPDFPNSYTLQKRGKRHDYFTSCLPWPQKGPSVSLPLGTTAPLAITTPPSFNGSVSGINQQLWTDSAQTTINAGFLTTTMDGVLQWSNPGLVANLSSATAATINQLREAFQVQRLYEKDARGGTRYIEILKNHFGVTSPDARVQRAEYLGGGSSPVNVTPIPQQSESGVTPQGNLAGIGTTTLNNHGFTKSFTEHCIIIGLVNVRADLTYQKGLDRMYSRQTRFDYYWPTLAHIGEQAVLNKEIYAQGSLAATDENVFGYQERFAEYRYKPSLITGKFRSNDPASLDAWHLSQDFLSLPTLGPTFITENPPIDRVVAVPSEPDFLFDAYFRMKCARPMPLYSVPGMIDHF